jgi:hypothetical protein
MTMPDPDALRIGTRERESAIAVLQRAVGEGYLELREFEERSLIVYGARTRGELRAALADLPEGAALFPPPAAPGAAPAVVVDNSATIALDWGTVKRRGRWQVPTTLFISGTLGTADLDLRHAVLAPTGCLIDIAASWSTIKILLGPSMVARTDEFLGGSMTTMKDKAGPPLAPAGPVIDICGTATWSTVVLRRG